jgi:leucyl-tRNA synthetase
LGTKFPFDKTYTIEPISDSTLYPIFYLVSLYINQGIVKEEQLTENFFDFVYLGLGDSEIISKEISLDIKLLLQIRKDVEYWYPLDINLGGQDHLTVHFPVFLMNHVALLPKKYWPKGIIVNWWVINKSGKISKSKGGVRSIGQEAKTYSVDAIRLFYSNIASPFVNIDFPEEDLIKYKQRLEKIYYFIVDLENNFKLLEIKNLNNIDRWLESKFNQRLKNIIGSMDKIEFKEAKDDIYFNIYNDLHWYLRRGGNNKTLLKEIIKKWTLSFGLFTPHIAEELNEVLGNQELVSTSVFPKVNDSKIDESLDTNEKNIENISSEIRTVLKMANIEKPKTIKIIVSKSWKYDFYKDLKSELEVTRNVGQIISTLMSKHLDYKSEIGKMVPRLLKQPSLLENIISQDVDFNFFKDILLFLESEFTTKIEIYKAEDFNDIKSETATPGKPGIIVE